jgi:hypothetical protein
MAVWIDAGAWRHFELGCPQHVGRLGQLVYLPLQEDSGVQASPIPDIHRSALALRTRRLSLI